MDVNWLHKIAQADLSWILSGPSEDPRVGQESGSPISDGIAVYSDPNGSYRYVYYEGGQPIAGMQVVSDGSRSNVANVYTKPEYQRRGLATKLFQRAQSDFPDLQHSSHKTDEGGSWIDSLEAKPMSLPKYPEDDWQNAPDQGANRINKVMTPGTAEEQLSSDPNMEYKNRGSFGVVYQSGRPGEAFKYTKDPREAETIQMVHEQQYDWVVPIIPTKDGKAYEQIQADPPVFKILMKEMEPLSQPESMLVGLLSNRLERIRDGWIESMDSLEEVMEAYVAYLDVDKIMYLYKRMKYIYQQNNDTLWLTDLHSRNFGWDGDELKVWDVGPDRSQ